ncbi:hypothetical protein E4U41_004876 [Claviceps citrina]|nr:hypothetical protein E4U41_004876 [Claviceps citrina]
MNWPTCRGIKDDFQMHDSFFCGIKGKRQTANRSVDIDWPWAIEDAELDDCGADDVRIRRASPFVARLAKYHTAIPLETAK